MSSRAVAVILLAIAFAVGSRERNDGASTETRLADLDGTPSHHRDPSSEIHGGSESVPPVVVAAGDIASCRNQHDSATAALLDSIPGIVLTLGDNAYDEGTYEEFMRCYHPTWGRHRHRTKPSPGNHGYRRSRGVGYFRYFGRAAGTPEQPYYSFDFGDWHIMSLNTNIDVGPRSAQVAWLRSDLRRPDVRRRRCALAFMHHPIRSSGKNGNNPWLRPLWDVLHEEGVDLVLAAHDHDYERFAPLTREGKPDSSRGIRLLIVGTGGGSLRPFAAPKPHSEFRQAHSFGVVKVTLQALGYQWEFIAAGTRHVMDSGTATCH